MLCSSYIICSAPVFQQIAELITPKELKIPIHVIFQTVESLHIACPTNTSDWYFTGNYPAGGNRVVNKAFISYVEGKMFAVIDN